MRWPWQKRPPYVPTGRVGFVHEEIVLQHKGAIMYEGMATYRVEELGRFGTDSRLKVLGVAGIDSRIRSRAWDALDGTLYPTNDVRWEEA